MVTIYDREKVFKIILERMDIPFIQSKRYISFYEGEALINVEPDYLVDNGVNFVTDAMTMSDFNNETNYFLENWFDEMDDDRFEQFLTLYKNMKFEFDLFFLKFVA